jgi:hypothetical protein
MSNTSTDELTPVQRVFLEPKNTAHRQYEALRAYFVDETPSAEAAKRFGYTPGSFRVLCHDLRRNLDRPFFLAPEREKRTPARQRTRTRIIELRKRNYSIYDISRMLGSGDDKMSPAGVAAILKEEGFARLPRRGDDERPESPRPSKAAVANVAELDLSPRRLSTKYGGLFLFVPLLVEAGFDRIIRTAGLPGTSMVPNTHAMRSLLALKLFGKSRHPHVMSDVFDDGIALFPGLNAIPKRSFLSEYSSRIAPASYPRLMRYWFNAVAKCEMYTDGSFDLDFHTIPSHGDDPLHEKHYVSKRSRRQKGILAFLAQGADERVFCYANAEIRKSEQNDEILEFVKFWKQRTGKKPGELVFDSKLTTYANLNVLRRMEIPFITLRRRSKKILTRLATMPASAWRQIKLKGVSRQFSAPRVLDEQITLRDYEGTVRQITVKGLGHEEPTLLLTNQLRRSAAGLVERYAQRMIIENGIADNIDFFHMDALSSSVAMKINCDLQLTLMGSTLYRILGKRIGNGYERAASRHIFRDFIDATARVAIDAHSVVVAFGKRAHNPLLIAAGFDKKRTNVPWLGGKELRLTFG